MQIAAHAVSSTHGTLGYFSDLTMWIKVHLWTVCLGEFFARDDDERRFPLLLLFKARTTSDWAARILC